MIYEWFKDTEWSKLLAIADPALDPFGEKGADIRLSVNGMLCATFVGAQEKSSTPDVTESFTAYAVAGEHFVRGMRALDEYRASAEMVAAHWGMRPINPPKPLFDKNLAGRIEQFCRAFRIFEKYLEEVDATFKAPAEKTGPNSKPWLHLAVLHLYDLWRDELGQGERTKKDFLAFAYAVLGPIKLGVTENSVLESFDRHVTGWKDNRHRMRQLGPL